MKKRQLFLTKVAFRSPKFAYFRGAKGDTGSRFRFRSDIRKARAGPRQDDRRVAMLGAQFHARQGNPA
jgi:hypothetical protein